MLALIPVRDGVLPAGADETVAECGGRAVLAGSAPDAAELAGIAVEVRLVELGPFAPARWADALGGLIDDEWTTSSCSRRRPTGATSPRASPIGSAGPCSPARSRCPITPRGWCAARAWSCTTSSSAARSSPRCSRASAASLHPRVCRHPRVSCAPSGRETLGWTRRWWKWCRPTSRRSTSPRPARIFAGGAGLDGPGRFDQLAAVAARVGAATGATRVVTDRGWVGHERQIGTTGVTIDPGVVRRPRDQRRRPAHRRARHPRAHREREH